MSNGQIIIYELLWDLIREREECVEFTTLLSELSIRFNNYTKEEQKEIKMALIGEENV